MNTDLPLDPFILFQSWMKEAEAKEVNDPNAMCLATANKAGQPSARMVLLKGLTPDGFCFYTNAESQKGEEIATNPAAALLFHWKSLRRQVRVEGSVEVLPDSFADDYFFSRPRGSRIGAWVSQQSRPLANYQTLKDETAEKEKSFAGDENIPRPAYWKGYIVKPESIEFWIDGKFRLHERHVYTKAGAGWTTGMLYP
jgi:pyridoxamine 5'-phosphate oxidase